MKKQGLKSWHLRATLCDYAKFEDKVERETVEIPVNRKSRSGRVRYVC